jgi:hypothetical protein
MAICPTCNQPINETVVQGRKFVARVPTGLNAPSGTGRYLTILNVSCACGSRTVRRYENWQSRELKLAWESPA